MDYPFGVCKVCGAPVTGNHYGAVTCEACEGLFKRGQVVDTAHQVPVWQAYQYYEGGHCQINIKTRTLCKECRYDKCVLMGMTIEVVQNPYELGHERPSKEWPLDHRRIAGSRPSSNDTDSYEAPDEDKVLGDPQLISNYPVIVYRQRPPPDI
ncbi:hypothetical protein RvY_04558 [Ramazzottius varieornatus]|uniref:Nuclear receptor domain-containing protein n=1 Tax=Ramazzottius varieornatus TaxID=947166 RepID=A0A1D1V181_RAMVA|nr:hypothetical protein RvY_04558 [Ramazzottius varieornatus]